MALFLLLLRIIIIISIVYIWRRCILHKLQNLPPRPFPSLPLIGHYLHLHIKNPLLKSLTEVSKRYGPVVFLQFGSRPTLLVSSPSLAEECLINNDITFADHPRVLSGKHFGYNYTSIASCPYGDHWRKLRRIASLDLLSPHRTQMFAPVRADEVRILIYRLFQAVNASRHRVISVEPALSDFMYNTMTRMVCGRRYVGSNVDNFNEAILFQDSLRETTRVMPDSQDLDFLPFLRRFSSYGDSEKNMMLAQKKRDRFMQNVLEEHRKLESDDDDDDSCIAQILLAMQKSDPEYLTDEMIKNFLWVLIEEGSGSSVETLQWALFLLLDNPNSLRKAQVEIDNLVGRNRVVNDTDVPQLKYLDYVIKETLRLQPPMPLLRPHESSADCTIGGYRVPCGTMLLVNVRDIQRNEQVWEEPEKFKPERFQDFDCANNGCKYLPFGSGRRACPGEKLAVLVVALALASLIHCFDWEKVNGRDMDDEYPAVKGIQPLVARCTPRLSMI